MARKTSKFLLGLFVTIGVLIGVAFFIWVGASKYFEQGTVHVTYFDESVQGLQTDSSVKYRGVDVGRVMGIRVAPDNRLVEVVMKIQLKDVVMEDVVTQLKSAGITGIVFIELDRRKGKEPVLGPSLSFESEYPVIPSRPSDIKQIMAGLVDLYERIKDIDFHGISDQFKGAAHSVARFFTNPKLEKTIENLDATTASLDRVAGKVDDLLADGKVDKILTETRETLADSRRLLATLNDEVKAMKLAEKTEKAGRLSDSLDRLSDRFDQRSRRVSANTDNLLRSLQRTSDQLGKLLERLQNRPSELLFSDPAPADEMR
jgi:phospholipid/cholesterol/gamma-HCH transport system substrate-binding protein